MKYRVMPIAISLILAGCASDPDGMGAAHVSTLKYQDYDCKQIGMELDNVSRKASNLHGQLKNKSTGDTVAMGAGLILFWPALFFLEGGDGADAVEYKRLKGEMEALEDISVQKKCGIQIVKEKPQSASAPTRSPISGAGSDLTDPPDAPPLKPQELYTVKRTAPVRESTTSKPNAEVEALKSQLDALKSEMAEMRENPKPPPTPVVTAPEPKPAPADGFVGHIGSYSMDKIAAQTAKEARSAGFTAYSAIGESKGREIIRVFIGPYATEIEALRAAKKWTAHTGKKASVYSTKTVRAW